MEKEMAGIESKIEETTDSQYLRVAFAANLFLSGIECRREFARRQQGCPDGNRQQRSQPGQLA
jgi:hypothetical protein